MATSQPNVVGQQHAVHVQDLIKTRNAQQISTNVCCVKAIKLYGMRSASINIKKLKESKLARKTTPRFHHCPKDFQSLDTSIPKCIETNRLISDIELRDVTDIPTQSIERKRSGMMTGIRKRNTILAEILRTFHVIKTRKELTLFLFRKTQYASSKELKHLLLGTPDSNATNIIARRSNIKIFYDTIENQENIFNTPQDTQIDSTQATA